VFKVSPGGKETVLYQFGQNDSHGCESIHTTYGVAGLVLDPGGNIYGTTFGSLNTGCCGGTVFKLDPSGNFTTLWEFVPIVGDISGPNSTPVRDAAGNLFGTASSGGNSSSNAGAGAGGVYKVDSQGNYSWLYLFNGGADGATPWASRLLLDPSGNLYGTTEYGGNLTCYGTIPYVTGCGVVFQVTPSGQETVLYTFQGGTDGANPIGDMAQDSSGSLYGVTQTGGAHGNGVVFRVSSTGQETVLYSFRGGLDGQPIGGVVVDAAGNLYGTTTLGGAYHRGSVFKLDPAGRKTDVYSFTGGRDGGRPFGTLILDADGHLYGTTVDGGANQQGAVFEIIP
jgi:uncharacterized repeat protein (TIGR03803 family)